MNEFLIKQGENEVAMEFTIEDSKGLPRVGDLCLVIKVVSNGYSGSNELWIEKPDFEKFCKDLVVLNKTRKGEALLVGCSPDEIEIKFHSVTSLGHIAVSGFTGSVKYSENDIFMHQIRFGFEFDPSQLEKLASSELIKRHVV